MQYSKSKLHQPVQKLTNWGFKSHLILIRCFQEMFFYREIVKNELVSEPPEAKQAQMSKCLIRKGFPNLPCFQSFYISVLLFTLEVKAIKISETFRSSSISTFFDALTAFSFEKRGWAICLNSIQSDSSLANVCCCGAVDFCSIGKRSKGVAKELPPWPDRYKKVFSGDLPYTRNQTLWLVKNNHVTSISQW